jgi:hypothetical protein
MHTACCNHGAADVQALSALLWRCSAQQLKYLAASFFDVLSVPAAWQVGVHAEQVVLAACLLLRHCSAQQLQYLAALFVVHAACVLMWSHCSTQLLQWLLTLCMPNACGHGGGGVGAEHATLIVVPMD